MNRRGFLGVLCGGLSGLGAYHSPDWRARAALAARRDIDGDRLVERWSWAMGQPVHLTLFARAEDAGLEAAALALAELRRVEGVLSLFDPASDLVALNERAGRGPVRVGPDLIEALGRAEFFRGLTGGAFDPAVEPLMRAWGFRSPRTLAPSPAELDEALRAVAAARVHVGDRTASLNSAESRVDLGGIGVGYGLDRAAHVLRRAGVRRALLDVSGDIIGLGAPPGKDGWRVDIASPSGGEPGGSVMLRDSAVATSANTMSVVRYGDTVTGHVLNPATGRAARAVTQVSVVAPTGIQADALSTAILVSGRREFATSWPCADA